MPFQCTSVLWLLSLSLLLMGCESDGTDEGISDSRSARANSSFHTIEEFDPEPPLDMGWLSEPIGRWVTYRIERTEEENSCKREKYVLESIRDDVAYVHNYCLDDDYDGIQYSPARYPDTRWDFGLKDCRFGGCYPSERSKGRKHDELEDIVIEGETFACTVTTYEWLRYDADDKVKGRHEVTLWQTIGLRLPMREINHLNARFALPTNTIKSRYIFRSDEASVEIVSRVTSLAKTERIGEIELQCVEETLSAKGKGDGKQLQSTSVYLLSNDVPGFWIKSDTELQIDREPAKRFKRQLESFGYENPEDETRESPVTILVRLRVDVEGSPCAAKVEIGGKTATIKAADADDLRKKLSDTISNLKPKTGECIGDISSHPHLDYGFLRAALQAISPHVTASFPLADQASRQAVKKNGEIMARVSVGYKNEDVIHVLLRADKDDPLSELDVMIPPRVEIVADPEWRIGIRVDKRSFGFGDTGLERLQEQASTFFRGFSSDEEASKSGCELITADDLSAEMFIAVFRTCAAVDDETNIARMRRTRLPGINMNEPERIEEELLEEEFFSPKLDEKETEPKE